MLIFFTILTNLLVAAACISLWRAPQSNSFLAKPSTQGAIALYIAVVGIVYAAILAKLWNPQGWQYVADFLIHRVSPLAFALYWLCFTPKGTLRWRDALRWLIYPLLYLIYALTRGAVGGYCPYPFIDVATQGAAAVAVNSLMMLALFVVLGLAIVAIDRTVGATTR